jgi:diaminopimelate epimerase
MHFTKLEGLGNDFIVVDSRAVREQSIAGLAQQICDRHFGIGADGLLVCQDSKPEEPGRFGMRVFNADGGEAELSGNGLRCLAAYVFRKGLVKGETMWVDTLAGPKRLRLVRRAGNEFWFEVEMGEPILDPKRIAFCPANEPKSLVGCELPLGSDIYEVTITSMGNPHCSLFVDQFELDWESIGRQIEGHPYFPNRTNVEFIRVLNRNEIEVRFWERGVGKTFSSGTGSCAAVVAGVLNGRVDRCVQVRTLGGDLELEWDERQMLRIQGPARAVCEGEYLLYPAS